LTHEIASLYEDIDALLASPVESDEGLLARLEDTLTDGYARALELEAERRRLERRLAVLARRLGDETSDSPTAELASAAERLTDAGAELVHLRAVLARLRERAREVRIA
jgi:hypothetical protein